MIQVSQFKKEDWFEITDAVEVFSDSVVDRIGTSFFDVAENGIAMTLREDGVVTACGGIIIYENSHAIWIKVSKQAAQRPLLLLESIGDVFKIMRESIGATEIISHVRDGFTKGEKMARFFGFTKTGEYDIVEDIKINEYIWIKK